MREPGPSAYQKCSREIGTRSVGAPVRG